ncbi:serum response factor-binding protein 1-like [Physella acuta]|uniref:serum response factor-binding protein 1-like n=1 Tax=Physella acuta TaxID=109671 RepID=UPI0027DCAB06|nr:serum response factor-binding protein 1-like [Physella acuta]
MTIMDSRSIDFAKTASIDMMALNNKIVKMRQTVKRSKVQVINKLCKYITELKKKKGTEEQKEKNLRKAERYIEEIDSIKKLKEDKVSKYALANTKSFAEVSKLSLLAGPRALARLADHPLMKKVVSDFRQQHQDWQDLAAYLLIKQTGRRFKTKKQKQKKLAHCVENINASETMTKAYIHERFGKEGLEKAEQRFERKRKRSKITSGAETSDDASVPKVVVAESKEIQQKASPSKIINQSLADTEKSLVINESLEDKDKTLNSSETTENNDENLHSIPIKPKTNIKKDILNKESNEVKDILCTDKIKDANIEREQAGLEIVCHSSNLLVKPSLDQSSSDKHSQHDLSSDKDIEQDLSHDEDIEHDLSDDEESSSSSEDESAEQSSASSIVENEEENNPETEATDEHLKNSSKKSESRSECVVKELNLGEDNSSDVIEDSSSSSSSDEDESDKESVDHTPARNKKNKKKDVPEFLTKPNKNVISDPFFGSDDEGEAAQEEMEFNEFDNGEDDFSFADKKRKVGSMFYNPHATDDENSKRARFNAGKYRGSSTKQFGHDRFSKEHRPTSWSGRGSRTAPRGSMRGRGSFGNRDRKPPHVKSDQPANTNRFKDSSSKTKVEPKTVSNTEKLHPSWEASKKRKAEQSSIAAFKGSKIVFDD